MTTRTEPNATTTATTAGPPSKALFWTGWVLTALPVPLLALSAAMKFMQPPEVAEGNAHLGWPMHLCVPLGIVELSCVALYLFPRTAVLGAILLTGYLGGATGTHVRVGDPWFVPPLLGVIAWLGLWCRDARVRALAPWRS
jgi:hypothetical protein